VREQSGVATAEILSEEFATRRGRAIEAARARGLDALLIWSRGGNTMDHQGDVLYLTNYASPIPQLQHTAKWSGRGHSVLILPVDDEPVLIVETADAPRDRVHISDVHFSAHIPQAAAEIVKAKGLEKRQLGLVARDTLLLSNYEMLIEAVGHDLALHPADDVLERLRMVKSDGEIAALRNAGHVGAGWMRTMLEAIEPGKTEADFVGEGLHFLAAHGGYPYDVAVGSGPDSLHYFGQRLGVPLWEVNRPVANGDLVHIDAWGPVANYYTDFARSTVVGRKASETQLEVLEGVRELVEHIMDAIQPGVIINELYQRGAEWLTNNGFGRPTATGEERGSYRGAVGEGVRGGRERRPVREPHLRLSSEAPLFGHGVGLGVEYPWIMEGEMTALEANMVMAVEFFFVKDGIGGAKYEHNVVVTPGGYEILDDECPAKWWD